MCQSSCFLSVLLRNNQMPKPLQEGFSVQATFLVELIEPGGQLLFRMRNQVGQFFVALQNKGDVGHGDPSRNGDHPRPALPAFPRIGAGVITYLVHP